MLSYRNISTRLSDAGRGLYDFTKDVAWLTVNIPCAIVDESKKHPIIATCVFSTGAIGATWGLIGRCDPTHPAYNVKGCEINPFIYWPLSFVGNSMQAMGFGIWAKWGYKYCIKPAFQCTYDLADKAVKSDFAQKNVKPLLFAVCCKNKSKEEEPLEVKEMLRSV